MKSVILYSSYVAGPNTQAILVGRQKTPVFIYIRAVAFNGDIERALRVARPRDNETVLNTIPLPE